MRRKLIAGNWKMNGSLSANGALLDELLGGLPAARSFEVLVFPPSVYLASVIAAAGGQIRVGAQTLSEQAEPGAFTGEVHGAMLRDIGCSHVLVGHSERRALYGETDDIVAAKFVVAQACGLLPVLCVGETLEQRDAGETETVLTRQLEAVMERAGVAAFANAVLAYEPVWAIGTGRTASPEQAQAAHACLRSRIALADATIAGSLPILYGGSVKGDNAASLLACADVDGGLVGGASLKAAEFLKICAAAQQSID